MNLCIACMTCSSGVAAIARSIVLVLRRCSSKSHTAPSQAPVLQHSNAAVVQPGAAGRMELPNPIAVGNAVGSTAAQLEPNIVDVSQCQEGEGEPLDLFVTNLSGRTVELRGLSPNCQISQLFQCVAALFGYQPDKCWHQLYEISQLLHGTLPLDNVTSTLDEVGVRPGSVLSFVWTADLVTLKFANGDTLDVKRDLACSCGALKEAMTENGDDVKPLPERIKVGIMKKALEYCYYHMEVPASDIQRPLHSTNLRECGVCDWDADYIEVEQELLFELIMAADALHMQSLLDLACAKVASMIKGKTTEEVRKQFNIVNDFTPEEEAQVREENRWLEDA